MASNYLDLISYGKNGIVVGDYNKIREVLVNRFKAIYGSDIDLSSTSADGQWIEEQALFINNMLQMIKQMYSNLDPREATGEFLDIIASYTNVTRRRATRSTVSVTISGLAEGATYTINEPLALLDRSGNVWTCEPFVADENGEATVTATCDEYGPIRANIGWLYTTVEQLGGVTITMLHDAIPGRNRESDAELRARRDNSLSLRGVTVLESIVSTILDINGLIDIKIYNNDTLSTITAKDGTDILRNSIYIIIRRNQNINIANSIIGSIIYEKKTPGIHTTAMAETATTGISKQFNYPNNLDIDQIVNWKEATPISPEVKIIIEKKNYFVSGDGEGSTSRVIANDVIEYLNNLNISEDISNIELLSTVLYADPLYRNNNTYIVKEVTIDGSADDFENPDTYFNYTTFTVDEDEGIITILIN